MKTYQEYYYIWVRSWNYRCLVTWFCYQLIAKPGNKTAAVPWPDPYVFHWFGSKLGMVGGIIAISNVLYNRNHQFCYIGLPAWNDCSNDNEPKIIIKILLRYTPKIQNIYNIIIHYSNGFFCFSFTIKHARHFAYQQNISFHLKKILHKISYPMFCFFLF